MNKPSLGNKKATNEKKTIKVDSFEVNRAGVFDSGTVHADITINGVTIYGVTVVEGKNGDFLSFPQRKGGNGKYYHIAYAALSEEDQKAILKEIEVELNK